MRSEAEDALAANPSINCPSFESSRVFALVEKLIHNPPAPLTRKKLIRNTQTIFSFIVQPDGPIDPSNPRTKPEAAARGSGNDAEQGGGAFRPALWYIDLKKNGTVGRGYPPKGVLGRKKRADVTIECSDKDLLHMAQGQQHPQRLFNMGRIRVRGDLDRALRIASLLNSERSRLFGVPPAPAEPAAASDELATVSEGADHAYEGGAPASITRAKL